MAFVAHIDSRQILVNDLQTRIFRLDFSDPFLAWFAFSFPLCNRSKVDGRLRLAIARSLGSWTWPGARLDPR
jgi:hypothetical protein